MKLPFQWAVILVYAMYFKIEEPDILPRELRLDFRIIVDGFHESPLVE
jgi:hypothetical protein